MGSDSSRMALYRLCYSLVACMLAAVAFGDIHSAIESDDLDAVRRAVSNGELNKRSDSRQSPVMHSVLSGRAAIVDYLIEAGMDPNDVHNDGYTPLHRACWGKEKRHAETVKVLLEECGVKCAARK